ncbi:MAG: hypothetical protein SOR90_02810 [Oscillospiraceae bacterium]|nr:hypothetical protein [Oscillospiraceae bacterium]
MKKVYSKRIGTEVFALAPEQLDVFKKAGYKTPIELAVDDTPGGSR